MIQITSMEKNFEIKRSMIGNKREDGLGNTDRKNFQSWSISLPVAIQLPVSSCATWDGKC